MKYDEITSRNFGVYGLEEQERIRKGKVGIIGIGCVGGLTAEILARIGIGSLTLVDGDIYEEINLNRQPFASQETIGMKKVEAGKLKIRQLNPFTVVESIDAYFSEGNAKDILLERGIPKFNIVLQCMDKMFSRIELHRACEEYGIAIITMTGQPPYRAMVSTFMQGSPHYEDFFGLPTMGKSGEVVKRLIDECKRQRAVQADRNGATAGWLESYLGGKSGWGVTPERVYISGTLQAHEALRYLTRKKLLAVAPKAIVVDLNNPPDIVSVRHPPNGKNWDYRMF